RARTVTSSPTRSWSPTPASASSWATTCRRSRPRRCRVCGCARVSRLAGMSTDAPPASPTATTEALTGLVTALPDGVVVTEPTAMEKYREDFARDGSAGAPLAVVRAETAEQVQTAVRWAARYGVPVVPRGAGTGLSGGSSAVD